MRLTAIAIILLLLSGGTRPAGSFSCKTGTVSFSSTAELETISAESDELKGLIDTATKEFAFSVEISTFEGFNSPLQKDHFRENYMESTTYPKATFAGKIIENITWYKDGTYTVRAKGNLDIHGVKTERIIKSTIVIKEGNFTVSGSFTVPLSDHNITIPTVVYQKIAEEIEVKISAPFSPKS